MTDFCKSPLNYIGGKYSLLNEIISKFPKEIDTFIDLFAGGLNVAVNTNAKQILANDKNTYLVDMFFYLKSSSTKEVIEEVRKTIIKYSLSKENADGYIQLRQDYNRTHSPLLLFVLTCYSFNHQIRFNNNFCFNTPFGKSRSSYNKNIENNLSKFCKLLKEKDIKLSSYDFRDYPFSKVRNGVTVVYCDPPYLITTGSYNDGKRGFGDWTNKEDKELFDILDFLNQQGIIFFLSNVLCHKGKKNHELMEWSRKYNVYHLNKSYSNCNYHLKNKSELSDEVLITNYGKEQEEISY
jgi:DNA adenine methylase